MRLLMGDNPERPDRPMQDLANEVCDGNLDILVNEINTFFTSLCEDMPALTEDNHLSSVIHPIRVKCDKFEFTNCKK